MSLIRGLAHKTFNLPSAQARRFGRVTRNMKSPAHVLAGSDPEQIRLMSEEVILVDHEDKVVGSMSKKDSHLVSNDLPLHRAFSIFLFDTKGRMLLQQRAAEKITFPSFWTNTVCSHPLHMPSELGLNDNNNQVTGAKRAALRKLSHELGVKEGAVLLKDLHYMTRIHYRADCDGGLWGEHEVDYIFMAMKDIELEPEPNEVRAVRYVTQEELKTLFVEAKGSESLRFTPWFCHIVNEFGWDWWNTLLLKGTDGLQDLQDTKTVHLMGNCGEHCSPRK